MKNELSGCSCCLGRAKSCGDTESKFAFLTTGLRRSNNDWKECYSIVGVANSKRHLWRKDQKMGIAFL